jgi:ABC-type branched-subunit amino acid transport system substrate-binding protein
MRRFATPRRALTAVLSLAALATSAGLAEPAAQPPTKQTVKLGMSTALTGPSARLGTGVLAGVRAAIEEHNASSSASGRTIELTALDDGYEPARAVPNTRELIEKHKVVAVIGNVGTPTAVATLPILAEARVPLVAAFTGAGALRKSPPDRYVINLRASYVEETGAMVDNLVTQAGLKPEQIALFTQRDAYGDAGFAGATAALKRHGLPDGASIVHARYDRNTTAVENAVADVLTAEPQPRAVIMVGAYAPCAEFIKRCKAEGLRALFINVSFVGTAALAETAGSDGEGVYITQVVPHPESDAPLAVDFRKAMSARPAAERNLDFTALEGYAGARMLLRALGNIKDSPSSDSIVDALEALGTFDGGTGEPLKLSATDHQASHRVWLTVLRGGKAVPAQWSDLKPKEQAGVNP